MTRGGSGYLVRALNQFALLTSAGKKSEAAQRGRKRRRFLGQRDARQQKRKRSWCGRALRFASISFPPPAHEIFHRIPSHLCNRMGGSGIVRQARSLIAASLCRRTPR